jgi:hypothetical protein
LPWVLVLSLAVAACSQSKPAEDVPDAGADASLDDPLDEFFSLTVHDITIDVDDDGVESLLEQPKVYVEGAVQIDDSTYSSVGVRLKGSAGSFVPLDGDYPEISGDGNGKPGKSAFIVDFNRYVNGANHLGLEKLTINNMVQDPSCIHEFVGYSLFREGEVPASRSGFASVTFNGEDKGLYALIESQDNDVFLDKWYGTSSGNLYEGAYGADLQPPPEDMPPEEDWWYDQDNGEDESKQDLHDLIEILDAIGEDEDPIDVLEQYFDLDEYLTFAATELYLGHWDGYAWSTNNYAIHHHPSHDTWTFLPWGIDQLFEDELWPFAGVMKEPGPSWGDWGGRVHRLCFRSEECLSQLHLAFEDLIDRVEAMDLLGLARDARDLVEDLALAESTVYGDPERTVESLDRVEWFIEERGEGIEAWLPCLVGQEVDNDGDEYDGCSADCDDWNPEAHPGAEEVCDFFDNDCNEVIDDPVECPKCFDEVGPGDVNYSFCFEWKTWQDARQHCQDQGQELASIHDPETFEFVTFGLWMIDVPAEEVWIGLTDAAEEGIFSWSDGTELDYQNWCSGAPHPPWDFGDEADCVVTAFWGWHDYPCDWDFPFVCRDP